MPSRIRRQRETILELTAHYTRRTMSRRFVSWSENLNTKYTIVYNVEDETISLRQERFTKKNRRITRTFFQLVPLSEMEASLLNGAPKRIREFVWYIVSYSGSMYMPPTLPGD